MILTLSRVLALIMMFNIPFDAKEENLKEIWLDEIDLSTMTTGWKTPQKNKSILGYPIKMNGKVYKRGVGVHAKSKLMLNLDGKAKYFRATLGVDDNGKEMSSLEFFILGDNKILWESGVLKKGDTKDVDLNIEGIKLLAFYVSDAKDGQSRDYANFANARFQTFGEIEPYVAPKEKNKIITPLEKMTPQINGPDIFGVRKDSPFLYKIPASGDKPIHYGAQNLPKGLVLDSLTGIMTGTLNKKGNYEIVLNAKNKKGSDQKRFEIIVGNDISLTPPMGWNSWNCWGKNIDQKKIEEAANAMVQKGLADYGWSYIVIDDAWQGNRDNQLKALNPNNMFPNIKKLSEHLHNKGLKFGIYSTPWITSFAGFCGTSSDSLDGYWSKEKYGNRKFIKHGEYSFERNDITQFVDWGVDYLKYDWNPIDSTALVKMGKEIKNAKRDIVFSISNSSNINDVHLYQEWCNLWRTTSDIRDVWDNGYSQGRFSQGIMDILRYHENWDLHNKPSSWNDPDMLVLGKVGWGKPRENMLTSDELYTHFTIWTMWSAPLMLGCDMEKIDKFTLSLLKNSEVIAINQDRLGEQAKIVYDKDGFVVLKKKLYNGDYAIAIINKGPYYGTPVDQFNWGNEKPRKIKIKSDDLKLDGKFSLRDVWKQKDIGKSSKFININVNHHGVVLLRLKNKNDT